MGTKYTGNKKAHSAEYGNSFRNVDRIDLLSTEIAAADVAKLCYVPGGTLVDRVVVNNTDMDTNATPTLTAKIGFSPVDGSAGAAGDDTAVSADAAFGQVAGTATFEIFPPFEVKEDSWLTVVIGTGAATGAAGTVHVKVEGEVLGVR